MRKGMEAFSYLLHAFYVCIRAPFCIICKLFLLDEQVLCQKCKVGIYPIVSVSLPITSTKTVQVFAVSEYKNPLKRLILSKGSINKSAAMHLGEIMWSMSSIQNQSFDYIVPIPLHWTRFAWRGYNQAAEIAKIISKKSGKPMINALKRHTKTKQQSFFSAQDRQKNVKNVFSLTNKYKDILKDKQILIIDDLMTTGATIQSAAKMLLEVKPTSIKVLVACRVR